MVFKKGQIGHVSILKPINLWADDEKGKLKFTGRVLQPNEDFGVYRYREKNSEQYDVVGGSWITNIDGYELYETPSKALLQHASEVNK